MERLERNHRNHLERLDHGRRILLDACQEPFTINITTTEKSMVPEDSTQVNLFFAKVVRTV